MSPAFSRPSAGATAEGQPRALAANGPASFAQTEIAGKADTEFGDTNYGSASRVTFCNLAGRVWSYTGKRGRVLKMLATMPCGVTQWDTLPWHTRLGGTIHVLRCDGLVIDTEPEGKFRHARYRLATAGRLLKQSNGKELVS